jgi:hypothetical protein
LIQGASCEWDPQLPGSWTSSPAASGKKRHAGLLSGPPLTGSRPAEAAGREQVV